MNASEASEAGTAPPLSSGPLVWATALLSTTLLLALLKQALWLVVPFLFAIVLYYALFPAVRRLTLAGVARETAAAVVAGAFFVAAAIAMVPAVSWLAGNAVSGEEAFFRYLDTARRLTDRTLLLLESQFGFLERMGLHATVGRKLAEYGGMDVQEHLAAALLAAAAWLPSLLLAPFLAFFFLRDGRRFLRFLTDAVPNAYFERTLYMIERVNTTARAYFEGLLRLTVIDTACLAGGLALLGVPGALLLGAMAAVLAWVPWLGSIAGCVIVALVTATDFPGQPQMVYGAVALFVVVRLLDDFVFMPLTVGRSLRLHPLATVLMLFVGGAVAGMAGLVVVLPLAGVAMVVAGTIGGVINDPRLRARHAFARALRARRINADLQP